MQCMQLAKKKKNTWRVVGDELKNHWEPWPEYLCNVDVDVYYRFIDS